MGTRSTRRAGDPNHTLISTVADEFHGAVPDGCDHIAQVAKAVETRYARATDGLMEGFRLGKARARRIKRDVEGSIRERPVRSLLAAIAVGFADSMLMRHH